MTAVGLESLGPLAVGSREIRFEQVDAHPTGIPHRDVRPWPEHRRRFTDSGYRTTKDTIGTVAAPGLAAVGSGSNPRRTDVRRVTPLLLILALVTASAGCGDDGVFGEGETTAPPASVTSEAPSTTAAPPTTEAPPTTPPDHGCHHDDHGRTDHHHHDIDDDHHVGRLVRTAAVLPGSAAGQRPGGRFGLRGAGRVIHPARRDLVRIRDGVCTRHAHLRPGLLLDGRRRRGQGH